jgi:glycosyltransferase involved in cell wall biosynthesis
MTVHQSITDETFSVLICTCDRVAVLRETVELVLERLADFKNSRLVIVDNASRDETAEYLANLATSHDNVLVATESKPGVYHARARAISMATGAFFLFLDDDVIPGAGWPQTIIEELRSSADVGVVGTSVVPVWQGDRPVWVSPRIERNVFGAPTKERTICQFPRYPYGCSAAYRMNDIVKLFVTPERRQIQLGWGSGTDAVGGEDWDLPEIYIRNGFKAVVRDDVSVGHRIVAAKVDKKWVLHKFEADGRLHVRYARLAGRPVLTKRIVVHLLTFPAWRVLSAVSKPVLGDDNHFTTMLQTFAARGRGLWHELLFGERHVRYPFSLKEVQT